MLHLLRVVFFGFAMMSFFTGCGGPRYVDYFPYHDNGIPKPRVVLMPVIDSSSCHLPWNVSEELSDHIYYDLMDSGELYVLSKEEVGLSWNHQIDLFNTDLHFTKEFCTADFIIALDLIQHELVPCDSPHAGSVSPGDCHPYNRALALCVRARVIDVRRDEPRVILYELIRSNYVAAPPYDASNYEDQIPGTIKYDTSPCGIVHTRIVKNIVSRLENVIQTAR